MRRRRAWLLIAGVGIASGVGITLDSGHRPDQDSRPTASTTVASGAVAEFTRMNNDRTRTLDAWDQAQSALYAAFLPISTKVLSDEQRIKDQAAATMARAASGRSLLLMFPSACGDCVDTGSLPSVLVTATSLDRA
jgi:hypothetical protein